MPKLKSNSGAAKRFKARGKGFKYRAANRNHILTKNTQKSKRHRRHLRGISKVDQPMVKRMLQGS